MGALAAVLSRRALAGQGVRRAQRRPSARRPVRIAPVKGSTLSKLPARLCRRSFGLPTARAPAHNLPGQQGLKISPPTVDRLAQALQSNEVSLPQAAIDDLRRLGAAADKR